MSNNKSQVGNNISNNNNPQHDISSPSNTTSLSNPNSNSTSQPQTTTSYTNLKTHLTVTTPHEFYLPPTSPLPLVIPSSRPSASKPIPQHPPIASLSLHPTLEAILHILNHDLPSAHFLCRHMESAPAYESMYVHGILHRIEGDLGNTRAWYTDVRESEAFVKFWGEGNDDDDDEKEEEKEGENNSGGKGLGTGKPGSWKHFLTRIERFRDRVASRSKRDNHNHNHNHDTNTTKSNGEKVNWEEEHQQLTKISLDEITSLLTHCESKFGIERFDDVTDIWVKKSEYQADVAKGMIVGGEGWREF